MNLSLSYLLEGTWNALDSVSVKEGNSVGDYNEKSLDECKDLCKNNYRCNSFAFGNGGCHLKDECIQPNEPQKLVETYQTHFKDCEGLFTMNRIFESQ